MNWKSMTLQRTIRGRWSFPGYVLRLEAGGKFHWTAQKVNAESGFEGSGTLAPATLAEITTMAGQVDWEMLAKGDFLGGESEATVTEFEMELPEGASLRVQDDLGQYLPFFAQERDGYAYLKAWYPADQVDQLYRYFLFLFHLERLLGVPQLIEQYYPQEHQRYVSDLSSRYSKGVPKNIAFFPETR